MATSFTGLSEAQIDDIIIEAILSMLPYFGAFSTQLDHPEGLVKGNDYIVPIVGALTVGNKTPGTLVTPSGSVTGVPVTVNTFKGAAFEAIEGELSARLVAAWWKKQIAAAAVVVAQTCVDAALGLVTAANYGSGDGDVVTDADFDTDTIVALRAAAKNKLNSVPGAFICNALTASRLIALQQVVIALAEARNAVSEGVIPGRLVGYPAYEYVDLPHNSEHLVAAVIGQSAIAVAAGAPEQLISSGEGDVRYRRIIAEPESGLSVQYTEVVQGGGKVIAELGLLFGVKKAQDAVVRLVTE